jgi:hypothetical protein
MGGPGWVKKDPTRVYIIEKYLVNLLIYRLVYIVEHKRKAPGVSWGLCYYLYIKLYVKLGSNKL